MKCLRAALFLIAISVLFSQPFQAMAAGLFNSSERPATNADAWHRKIQPLWQRVLQEEKERPGFTAKGVNMSPGDAMTWRNLIAAVGDIPKLEALRMVNGYFNQWPPKKDEDAWGKPEYWTTPREFFQRRGGDCEDYAIAKYFALRYFKINPDRMRIVIVRMRDEKGAFMPQLHAVLAVRADSLWFILDNNARPKDNIFPHTMYKGRFVPLYSVNEKGAWIHGEPEKPAPVGGVKSAQ